MDNKTFGYARVSTKDQNLERQIEALKEYGVGEREIFKDKASGKDFDREQYQLLKGNLRKGDTLVIKELDRLGRNMEMMKDEWRALEQQEINIVVIDTPILNTEGKSDLEKKVISSVLFELLVYLSEKERNSIRQRQREGIEQARARGVHLGRPKATLDKANNFHENYNDWKNQKITAVECMNRMGLKKTTFYKLIKQYENGEIKAPEKE